MSRRSPRNWDGAPARRRPAEEVVVVCTDDGQHGERVVGRLGWAREGIDRADPRWQPDHFVLWDRRGKIIAASDGHGAGVRLHCDVCHRDLQRSEAWIVDHARRLIRAQVHRVELVSLIRLS